MRRAFDGVQKLGARRRLVDRDGADGLQVAKVGFGALGGPAASHTAAIVLLSERYQHVRLQRFHQPGADVCASVLCVLRREPAEAYYAPLARRRGE